MRNIKSKRLEKGLTQEQLAKKAHVTRQYLNMLENGKCQCSIKTARLIAEALDCDWTELYDD